uniref:Uncharacterized protein n=1 Tax=Glossina pallidipes TaxID=7398 RepID=A0A1A9Z275_GLOPL
MQIRPIVFAIATAAISVVNIVGKIYSTTSLFNLGNCQIIEINLRYIFELRLVYLEYLRLNASGHYKQCMACLQQMSQIMSACDEEPFILHLPNLSNVCLDVGYIDRLKNDFQQQIDANRTPKLFENGEWQQLAEIIIFHRTSTDTSAIVLKHMYEVQKHMPASSKLFQ